MEARKLRVVRGNRTDWKPARERRQPMTEIEVDRKFRDLAVYMCGFFSGILAVAWLVSKV